MRSTPLLQALVLSAASLSLIFVSPPSGAVAQVQIVQPKVSEEVCPATIVTMRAQDDKEAAAVIRRPPGDGPFPAIVFLHGGLNQRNVKRVKRETPGQPTNSRFLAAGYVTVEAVFRGRSDDPQSKGALLDCLAILDHVKQMPEVDAKSVVLLGHSGGGSLALELAGMTPLSAVAAGEPASIIFTGMYNQHTRRRQDRDRLMENPLANYTPELQRVTREKIRAIACPVLIVHGDQHPINKINREIIVPELQKAGKEVEVIAYPGQPHNFVFGQNGSQVATLKCFEDCHRFFKKSLTKQPTELDAPLVTQVPVDGK